MLWSVFEVVWMKTHDGMMLAKSICNRDSILQKKCALMDEEVLRVKGSCSRLVREYAMCGQSLFRLLLARS